MKAIMFVSARWFLKPACLLVLLIAVVPASRAVVVKDLYNVEFPVPDQSRQVRNAVFTKGLEEVLIRVSGNRLILQEIKPAGASTYVQQFSYVEKQAGADDPRRSTSMTAEPEAASYSLKVRYNAARIISLLRENGQPVWGEHRSEAIVWLAVRDGKNRYVLKASDESLLKAAVTESADRRGLPVIWPANDRKDQQQLRFIDLWAAFAEPVRVASKRYGDGPVIVGRLSWTGSVWKGDWSLFIDTSVYSWSFSGSDYNALISEGIDHSADKIGKHYAVLERSDSAGTHLLVEITNVDSVRSYRTVQTFLDDLAAVRQTHVVRLGADGVVFRVDLRGDVDDFTRLVAIDRKLEPVIDNVQPVGDAAQRAVLRYSYQKP